MAFVQTANSGTPSGTATSKTATFASAQTAGNLNVVVIVNGSASNTTPSNLITSVTDTSGNTYAAANTWLTCASGASGAGQIIYRAPNINAAGAGANTVTVATSAAVAYFSVTIAEYSGLATASPVDVVAGNKQDGSGTSTASTGSLTTTVATDTLFGSIAFFDGPNSTPGLTAGFTLRASYYTQLVADRVGVATGSYSMSAQSAGSSGWAAQLVAFKPSGGAGALSFPMAIADTSSVTALGFRVNRRFSFAVADTSNVAALGFRVGRRFPFTAADTSLVAALGLSVGRRFLFTVADTSLVTALGLRVGRRFPLAVADISAVTALGFRVDRHFPVHASDISVVLALGNPSPSIRFPFGIADISLVTALGFTRSAPGMVFAGSKVSPGGVPGVGVAAGTWTNLSLGTGWTAPVQGQYQIQISGTTTMVYFRGMIQAAYSALGTTAFTVSAGAQPSMSRFCVLGGAQNTGTPSDVASYLATVSSSGVCVIYFLCGAALTWADPTKTQQVNLDGLFYSL